MKPKLTAAWLLLSAAGPAALPAGAAGIPAPPREASAAAAASAAALREEARLAAPVTLAHRDIPLGELLASLSRQLGVKLLASRETRDDRVTLFLQERPAREALLLVARHLDFQWYRKAGGYELTQDTGGKRREAARRQGEHAAQVQAAFARMDRIARLASTAPAELAARRSELDARLSAPDLKPEERAALREELAAHEALQRQGGRAAASLYRGLHLLQLRQIAAGGEVRLASADGSLPGGATGAIHDASRERGVGGTVMRFSTVERGPGAPPRAADPNQLPPAGAEVSIRFGDMPEMGFNPGSRRGGARARLQFTMSSIRGQGGDRRVVPLTWSPNPAGLPDRPEAGPLPEDPDLQRPVELAFGRGAAAAPPRTGAGVPRIVGGHAQRAPGAWPAGQPTVGELAEALHRTIGLEFIADSFIRARLAPARVNGRRAAAEVLELIASELDYGWELEKSVSGAAARKLVRLRSNVYFHDRPAEVPRRLLRPWQERVARGGAPGLDDLALLAAALTDPQARGMSEYWGWYLEGAELPAPSGPGGFYGARHHLRFWATLQPVQRQAARTGILPTERMAGLQRQAFVAALTAPVELPFSVGPAGGPRMPTPAEVATGGFSLGQAELQQRRFSTTGPDGERREGLTLRGGAPGGPGGAAPILRGPGGPGGSGGAGGPGGGPVPPPRLFGEGGVAMEAAGAPSFLDGYTFRYHLAGQQQPARTANINVPRPQPKVAPPPAGQ